MPRKKEHGPTTQWSEEDDNALKAAMQGRTEPLAKGTWLKVALELKTKISRGSIIFDLSKFSKSCRLRWEEHLKPGLDLGDFTLQEDAFIFERHQYYKSLAGTTKMPWATIASELTTAKQKLQKERNLPHGPCIRSDNRIKNRWNSFLHLPSSEREAKVASQVKRQGSKRKSNADSDQGHSKRQRESTTDNTTSKNSAEGGQPAAPSSAPATQLPMQQIAPMISEHNGEMLWGACMDETGMAINIQCFCPPSAPQAAGPPPAAQATAAVFLGKVLPPVPPAPQATAGIFSGKAVSPPAPQATTDASSGSFRMQAKRKASESELGALEGTPKKSRKDVSLNGALTGNCQPCYSQPAWPDTPQPILPQLSEEAQPGLSSLTFAGDHQRPQTRLRDRMPIFEDFLAISEVTGNGTGAANSALVTSPSALTATATASGCHSPGAGPGPIWHALNSKIGEGAATAATVMPQPVLPTQSGCAYMPPISSGAISGDYASAADAAAAPSPVVQQTQPKEVSAVLPSDFGLDITETFALPEPSSPVSSFDSELSDILLTPEGTATYQKTTNSGPEWAEEWQQQQTGVNGAFDMYNRRVLPSSSNKPGGKQHLGLGNADVAYNLNYGSPIEVQSVQRGLDKHDSVLSWASSTFHLSFDPKTEALETPAWNTENNKLQQDTFDNYEDPATKSWKTAPSPEAGLGNWQNEVDRQLLESFQ